jgi:hypothetical protein
MPLLPPLDRRERAVRAEQRAWSAYRLVWRRLMTLLVGVGVASAAADVILRRPLCSAGACAVAGAASWVARARRQARWPIDPAHDEAAGGVADAALRLWSVAPFEVRLVAAVATGICSGAGLSLVLGWAGVQLFVAVAASGLPLLLAEARLGTLAEELAVTHGRRLCSATKGPAAASHGEEVDLRAAGTSASEAGHAPPPSGLAVELSVQELLDAWQASSRALAAPLDPAQRTRIIAARARYLDALQQHDPTGVADWLSSPHAPDEDPARFVHARPDTTP